MSSGRDRKGPRGEKGPRRKRRPEPEPGPAPEASEELQPPEAPGGPPQSSPDDEGPPLLPQELVIQLEAMPSEALEEEPPEEPAAGEAEDEAARMKRGMWRSRRVLSRPFTKAATRKAIDASFWEEAEEALIAADTGVTVATEVVEGARRRILSEGVRDIEGLKQVFREQVALLLESFGEPPELPEKKPAVLFVVGVNGVGKTTTAAKIGWSMKQEGRRVLFAAADTFRAAGIEQMEMWAARVGAPVVRQKTGGDPAAVVFDAVESALARDTDIVIVDTAGRLHTKKNLMEELGKMWRVADRQLETSPVALLVIDATTGQNGVQQARIFSEALSVGSIALTKMDGSARGGVVLAIGRELGIPVSYVGVGEGMADLRPFDPVEYANALF